jgi:drug/metabolite transporter (DMT)-like permease
LRSATTPPLTTARINLPATTPAPHPSKGYLLVAAAAALWGTSGVIARFLFNNDVRPFDLLMIRTVTAALLHWLWLGLSARHLLRIEQRDLPRLALFGLIGVAVNQGCYYIALKLTSVGYALLFQYTAPFLLMGYGILAKTERMTTAKLLAGVLSLCGCALMMLGHTDGQIKISWMGTLAALGSAVAFAFYSAYGQRLLRQYDSRTVMTYAFTFAGFAWLLARPPWVIEWQHFDSRAWGFIAYLSAFATVVPFGLYLASLRYLEPSRANLTSALEPVIAAALAWVWLDETMGGWQILGGLAVLLGVALLQMESRLRLVFQRNSKP